MLIGQVANASVRSRGWPRHGRQSSGAGIVCIYTKRSSQNRRFSLEWEMLVFTNMEHYLAIPIPWQKVPPSGHRRGPRNMRSLLFRSHCCVSETISRECELLYRFPYPEKDHCLGFSQIREDLAEFMDLLCRRLRGHCVQVCGPVGRHGAFWQ